MRFFVHLILTWVMLSFPLCFCAGAHASGLDVPAATHSCCSEAHAEAAPDACPHCSGIDRLGPLALYEFSKATLIAPETEVPFHVLPAKWSHPETVLPVLICAEGSLGICRRFSSLIFRQVLRL